LLCLVESESEGFRMRVAQSPEGESTSRGNGTG
jgi:hypothetical protein